MVVLSKPFQDLDNKHQIALAAGAGLIVTYLLYRTLSGPSSKFRHPFAEDCRRPREPIETDREKRKLRIRKRFLPELVPETLDAIVIGSGIGGLASGAILAKSGRKVLVVEQHGKVGGWCHTFIKDDTEFDVGIHYVGRMGPKEINRFVIDQITEGQVEFNELSEDFDAVTIENPETKTLDYIHINKDSTKFMNSLISRYPQDEAGIREYFRMFKEATRSAVNMPILKIAPKWLCKIIVALKWPFFPGMRKFLYYFNELRCQDVLEKLFPNNKDLQVILSYCWGNSGSPPKESSFGLVVSIMNHYSKGSFYPHGSANEISYNIMPVIEKHGGQVLMNVRVLEILLSDDKSTAVGVRVETGKKAGKKIIDIHAPIIISDAGVLNTFRRLLPPEVSAKTDIGRLIKSGRIRPSCTMLQVFIGLLGNQEELELPTRNYWVSYSNTPDDLEKWNSLELEEACKQRVPLLFLGFPGAKDPEYNSRFPNRSACIVITVVPSRWFKQWVDEPKGKRGEQYQSYKMAIAEQMWEQILEMFPQLSDRRRYMDAATPVTVEHYINAINGESYGIDHGRDRFSPELAMALRPEVPEVKNLYLTGQDLITCGFNSALTGGLLCAHTILNRFGETKNLYEDIKKLYKKCQGVSKC